MSDLTTQPEAAAKLDALRRPHRLRASDGGGIIFPNGFFGPGYYLPGWEYLRYCARADHYETDPQSLTWYQRHILRPSFALKVAIFFGAWVLARLANSFVEDLGSAAVLFVIVLVQLFWGMVHPFYEHPRMMADAFPSVVRVPFYGYWSQHLTCALTNFTVMSWLNRLFSAVLANGLLVLFCLSAFRGPEKLIYSAALATFFVVPALYVPVILASAAIVRLRLGRSPTQMEHVPVDPPTRPVSA